MKYIKLTKQEVINILQKLPKQCVERVILEYKLGREIKPKISPGPTKKGKKDAERYRKKLIENSTAEEKIIQQLLNKANIKYTFQKVVYTNRKFFRVLDFHITEPNIILEIDGDYHNTEEQRQKDDRRTQELAAKGYTNIYRITNEEVRNGEFPKQLAKYGLVSQKELV